MIKSSLLLVREISAFFFFIAFSLPVFSNDVGFEKCTGNIREVGEKIFLNNSEKQTIAESISPQEFKMVPSNAKPWVYWWWLKGNVSKESITRELEELSKKGVGGVLLFDSRGYHDDYYTGNIPVPLNVKIEFMSPEWVEMVKHALDEAKRLGMAMSINLSNTGGSLRGPWDMGPDGPKRLIWSAVDIEGESKISVQLHLPEQKEYAWDVALLAVKLETNPKSVSQQPIDNLNTQWYEIVSEKKGDAALASEIIDLSANVKDGKLIWNVPEGKWRILRFVTAVFEKEGHHEGTSAGKGSVDILNAHAVETYFQHVEEQLLKNIGGHVGTTLKYLYNVSWEGVYPNWTNGFEEEFKKFRGYDLKPYLPALAGMIIKNQEITDRFMNDYYRTLSNMFQHNCYQKIGELCHQYNIQWHSENGGPWLRESPLFSQADMLDFWGINDIPQGEFWVDNFPGRSNVRFTAMAAHIYERPLVAVEAFTHMDYHWSKYPAFLKPFADMNFIDGANMFIWHTFTSSPKEAGVPGYEYFAGTHINPNITWWNEAGNFFDYLGRCQYLLRKGDFVADALVYVSDKNYERWGRGEKWNKNSSLSLNPGYTYDLVNSDVLLNRLTVKDGELTLPQGRKYKILLVDLKEKETSWEVLQKIVELIKDGATVVLSNNIPLHTAGLSGYSQGDSLVQKMGITLWGDKNTKLQHRTLGKGKIYKGISPHTVLLQNRILPDFEGPFEYHHRSSKEFDIYFISGSGQANCTFRIFESTPELWDPVTGKVSKIQYYHTTNDGRISIPINLAENGSAFIVFRKTGDLNFIIDFHGPEQGLEIVNMDGEGIVARIWKQGRYKLKNNAGNTVDFTIDDAFHPFYLNSPWQVQFEKGWGAPEQVVFEQLIPWNEHSFPGIKYFSGTATYKQTFKVSSDKVGKPAKLNLEEVHDIAHVYLNGHDLGTVWTSPWEVDITTFLKSGENTLIIEVTNCWANRLIGDASLAPKSRFANSNVRLVSKRGNYREFEAYAADDTLMPSGLIGPVKINFGVQKQIKF
jgi:hypothetical protein